MYGKIENGKLIQPPKTLNTSNGLICNFNQNVEAMESEGYTNFDDTMVSKYFAGLAEIQDGQVIEKPVNPKELILADLARYYSQQDPFLQAQFEPTRVKFVEAYLADDSEKINALLNSPYIPEYLSGIVSEIKRIAGI